MARSGCVSVTHAVCVTCLLACEQHCLMRAHAHCRYAQPLVCMLENLPVKYARVLQDAPAWCVLHDRLIREGAYGRGQGRAAARADRRPDRRRCSVHACMYTCMHMHIRARTLCDGSVHACMHRARAHVSTWYARVCMLRARVRGLHGMYGVCHAMCVCAHARARARVSVHGMCVCACYACVRVCMACMACMGCVVPLHAYMAM